MVGIKTSKTIGMRRRWLKLGHRKLLYVGKMIEIGTAATVIQSE